MQKEVHVSLSGWGFSDRQTGTSDGKAEEEVYSPENMTNSISHHNNITGNMAYSIR